MKEGTNRYSFSLPAGYELICTRLSEDTPHGKRVEGDSDITHPHRIASFANQIKALSRKTGMKGVNDRGDFLFSKGRKLRSTPNSPNTWDTGIIYF